MSIEVLVTDGDRRPGLAVIRSLARQGISFIVIGAEPDSLSFSSRYARHTVRCPSPATEPEAFVATVMDLVRRHDIRLVMPVLEDSLLALDRHRTELEQHTRLAAASSAALRQVQDKRLNYSLADRLGMDSPHQFELDSLDQLPEIIDQLGFPLVLKPPGSPHDPLLPSFPFKVLYANDATELRGYLDQYCADGVYPLLQEYIRGEFRNVNCFAAAGKVIAMHEHHSLRTLKGQGVLREVVPVTPQAAQSAEAMLKALRWDGVAQVCFIVDSESGRARYLETNGRFWSSVAGSVHAGWDFPGWQYRYFIQSEVPDPGPLSMGSRTCWHRGDLVALANYLLGGEAPGGVLHSGKGRAVLDYLAGFSPTVHADVFALHDPLPEMADHWQLLKKGIRSVLQGRHADAERLSSPTRR